MRPVWAGRHGDRVGVSGVLLQLRHDGVLLSAMGLLARAGHKRHDEALAIREGAWEIVRHWGGHRARGSWSAATWRSPTRRSIGSRTRSRSGATSTRADAMPGVATHGGTLMCATRKSRDAIEELAATRMKIRSRARHGHRRENAAAEGGIFLSFRSTLAYGLYKNPGASLLDTGGRGDVRRACVVSRRVLHLSGR